MQSSWFVFLEKKKKGTLQDVYLVRAQTIYNARALVWHELSDEDTKDKQKEKLYGGLDCIAEFPHDEGTSPIFWPDDSGTFNIVRLEMD